MIYNDWNSWSDKSENISFETNVKGLGDGEHKVSAEQSAKIMGQNVCYDLELPNGEKWECKKPDRNNSFRLGVESCSDYTILLTEPRIMYKNIRNVFSLLHEGHTKTLLENIIKELDLKKDNKKYLSLWEGIFRNELCAPKIQKIDEHISILKELCLSIPNTEIEMFHCVTGKKEKFTLIQCYRFIKTLKLSKEEMINIMGSTESYNLVLIYDSINSSLNKFENDSMRTMLNRIVRSVFHDKTLILVDKEKGYMPITNVEMIICNRITEGKPRCQIITI